VDAAREEGRAAGYAAGETAGRAAGEKAAYERINAILGSEEGKKRPKAETPEPKANATGKNFKEAMDEEKPLDLGTAGGQDEAAGMTRAQKLLARTKGAVKAAA